MSKRPGPRETALEILKYVAIGAMIGSVLVCPNLAQLYTLFDAEDEAQKKRVRRNLTSLQKRGLIKKGNSEGVFVATPSGVRAAEFDSLVIQPLKWDKKWRLFMFDIPETHRPARVILNKKVLQMGMQTYQKSIYISPYPCEAHLRKATQYLQVEKYVRFVLADKIDKEEYFKKAFGV